MIYTPITKILDEISSSFEKFEYDGFKKQINSVKTEISDSIDYFMKDANKSQDSYFAALDLSNKSVELAISVKSAELSQELTSEVKKINRAAKVCSVLEKTADAAYSLGLSTVKRTEQRKGKIWNYFADCVFDITSESA